MVGLDGTGFDDVRIDRSLSQETDAVQLAGLFLENAYELRSDDFPFLLRISHSRQFVEETVRGVDIHQVGSQLVAEYPDHLLRLTLAEESVIDVYGNQLPAHRLDKQCRYN